MTGTGRGRESTDFLARLPALALIASNLIVVGVTLFRQWGCYEIILIYWCEAIIIGAFNVGRLVLVGLLGKPLGAVIDAESPLTRLFLLILALGFFVVKFGGFALAMGLLVAMVPAFLAHGSDAPGREIWAGLSAVGGGVGVAFLAMTLSHGVSFVLNFIGRQEYRHTNLLVLLFWPYVRMSLVMMSLAAGLVAAALLPALGASTVFGVAIVLLKLGADIVMHRIEHAAWSGGSAALDDRSTPVEYPAARAR